MELKYGHPGSIFVPNGKDQMSCMFLVLYKQQMGDDGVISCPFAKYDEYLKLTGWLSSRCS